MRGSLRKSQPQVFLSSQKLKPHVSELSEISHVNLQHLKNSLKLKLDKVKFPPIQPLPTSSILASPCYLLLQQQYQLLKSQQDRSLMKLKEFYKTKCWEQKERGRIVKGLMKEIGMVKRRIDEMEEEIVMQERVFEGVEIEWKENDESQEEKEEEEQEASNENENENQNEDSNENWNNQNQKQNQKENCPESGSPNKYYETSLPEPTSSYYT